VEPAIDFESPDGSFLYSFCPPAGRKKSGTAAKKNRIVRPTDARSAVAGKYSAKQNQEQKKP
jgi:hypothetical protein